MATAVIENPKKAPKQTPLVVRVVGRNFSTGTILMVSRVANIQDRMGNSPPVQMEDTPINDCVVSGWLKPTAIATEYNVDPASTSRVKPEVAAIGTATKKNLAGMERWAVPVVSRSFPYAALATNQLISWRFKDIPQGGSLVQAGVFVVEPGSGLVAVKIGDFSNALRADQFGFVLPKAYKGKIEGGVSPRERDQPIPVLCGVEPIAEEMAAAVQKLIPMKLELSFDDFNGDICEAKQELGTYAELYLDLVVVSAALCRYKQLSAMCAAVATGKIVDFTKDRGFVVQLSEETSENKLAAQARYLSSGTSATMTEVQSDTRTSRKPHKLQVQVVTNFGEASLMQTASGARTNCVVLRYVTRDMAKQMKDAEKQALDELDELVQLMRETQLTEEQEKELRTLEKQIEEADFGDRDEYPSEQSGTETDTDSEEETSAFNLWHGHTKEVNVKIKPDTYRTGWEAKIAVLKSIKPAFFHTELGAAMMGLVHPRPVGNEPSADYAKLVKRLDKDNKYNAKQKEAIQKIIDATNLVVRIEAPASTGKTTVLAKGAAGCQALDTGECLILTAETNQAAARLLSDLAKMNSSDDNMLYVVSMAAEQRSDFEPNHPVFKYGIIPHLKRLADETISNIRGNGARKEAGLEPLQGPLSLFELKQAKIYLKLKEADYRTPIDDGPAIEMITRKNRKLTITVATCSKLQAHKCLLQGDVLFVDESSVCAESDFLALAAAADVRKVVVAGDQQQLTNHVQPGLEPFKAFGLRSVALTTAERAITDHCELVEAYRPHPSIFEVWNLVVYGGRLQCRAKAEERALVTSSKFPLPKKGVPILLLHDGTSFTKVATKSLANEAHQSLAYCVVSGLHKHVPQLKVTVLCLYAETRNRLTSLFATNEKAKQVEVTTVDAYEGQEQEAVIIVTTRTSGTSKFVFDERRLASAVTRPRDFVAVIGDFDYLEGGTMWAKYLIASVKQTPPVDASYIELLDRESPLYSGTGRLLDAAGKAVTSNCNLGVRWVESEATSQSAQSK